MIISHDNKFIFIAIPKTGTTSLQEVLKNKLKGSKYKIYTSNIPKNGFTKHMTITEVKNLIDKQKFNSYLKFAFVRNPYDIVVSWYTYLYRLNKKDNPDLMKQEFYQARSTFGMTFEDFIRNRKDIWGKSCQHKYITDGNGNLLVNRILKYENYNRALINIGRKVGINITNEDIVKKNESKYRKTLGKKYNNYFKNIKLKKIVYESLKKDFNMFEYDKEF